MPLPSFLHALRNNSLIQPHDRILIGVSGGPDSMALLHVLVQIRRQYGFFFAIAHINHSLRGKESDRDAAFVEKHAKMLGVPCFIHNVDTKAYARKHSLCIEDAARRLRQAFFCTLAVKLSCAKVALAHTMDDQAETVLMRIIAGTGPDGLKGMSLYKKMGCITIIRPLLFISKQEVLTYLRGEQIPFRVDRSNHSMRYTRNSIRFQLIPLLAKKYNPGIKEHLAHLAECMQEDALYMQQSLPRLFSPFCKIKEKEQAVCIERAAYDRVPWYLHGRLIRYALELLCGTLPRMTYLQLLQIKETLDPQKKQNSFFCGRFQVIIKKQRVYIMPKKSIQEEKNQKKHSLSPQSRKDLTLKIPGVTKLLERGYRICARRGKASLFEKTEDPSIVFFDETQLALPLKVTPWVFGDTMQVFGKKGFTKKVQDLLVDAKVPRLQRHSLALVRDGKNRIIWIAGVKRSNHACITPKTKRIVRLELTFSGKTKQ